MPGYRSKQVLNRMAALGAVDFGGDEPVQAEGHFILIDTSKYLDKSQVVTVCSGPAPS